MGGVIGRSLRAAVAAVLAWSIVLPMGGLADDYPFYAPLGAVVATTASVIGSVRETIRTIAAMALGVAVAVVSTPLPVPAALLLVVALGTALVTSWPLAKVLGDGGAWVPVTALFVLVIGGDDPWTYATAYVGLTALGALVALVVNATWPPLPLRAEARALAHVRDRLADRLAAVAHSLRGQRPPTPEEWQQQVSDLDTLVTLMRAVAAQAGEARRANWRVRRWADAAERRYAEARALERLALLVEDIGDLLADQEHAERAHVALGPDLRPYAAQALEALAALLHSVEGGVEDRTEDEVEDGVESRAVAQARQRAEELVAAMRRVRAGTGDDLITAGALATSIQRTLSSLLPEG